MMRDTHGTLRSSSTDPNDAMVASQQKHIADLVSRNKTLEHTTTRLRAAVAEEQERAADAVAQVQQRWEAERSEWRAGCDSLQAAHRIAHLRTAVDADRDHAALLEAKEALRRESIARVARDYKIVLFQAKELELEMRVSQLQRELEAANEAREDAVLDVDEEWQETATVLEARCTELAGQLKVAAAQQARAIREREQAEADLATLRGEHTSLRMASDRAAKNSERTELQFEALKTTHADLEKRHAESEATVVSLRQQVEKWAALDKRENAETENLRKCRIELEVKVKQLEAEKEEREKERGAETAKMEKLQRRLDKYKEAWEAHQKETEAAQEDADRVQRDLEAEVQRSQKLKEQLQASKQKVAELEQRGTAEDTPRRSNPGGPSKSKSSKASKEPSRRVEPEIVDDDVQLVDEPVAKQRPAPRPSGKARQPSLPPPVDEDDDIMEIDAPPSTKEKTKTKGKEKARPPLAQEEEEDSTPPTAKPKPKPAKEKEKAKQKEKEKEKQKKERKKAPAADGDDSDIQILEPNKPAAEKKGKRKADSVEVADGPPAKKKAKKTTAEVDDDEPPQQPAPKKRGRPPKAKTNEAGKGTAAKGKAAKSTKAADNGGGKKSQGKDDGEEDDEDVVVPKKKKRMINMFPTSQEVTFHWNNADGDGGLNIPTDLSPVKEGDIMPSRPSLSSANGSTMRRR
ncbi:hypothetical protein GSI_02333 [Ganoderma sinense ZZ0214-1]|uniref:Uncharacterized protein n=1 Tax=Ganoderma sinense ZZ0214-1 TaxID=1077348 RepID=A0A2G8SPB5_9APHY|nr:hypothetical protein GSI_02333 [Ganoderma sinense ZZ0214-1]